MFDFNSWEFLALGIAAILIFGPERLPGMIRKAGEYYGQLQTIANGFRRELEAEVNAVADPLKEAATAAKIEPPSPDPQAEAPTAIQSESQIETQPEAQSETQPEVEAADPGTDPGTDTVEGS